MKITCIILSGGRASRMNGVDKGLVKLYNTPLVRFVIEKMKMQTDEILISANRNITEYAAFGFPVLQDAFANFIGPLAGLHAGLSNAKYDYVLCVPCDMPNLPSNFALRLFAKLNETGADIAVVTANGDTFPVLCLCKKSLLPSLTAYIEQGGRKVSTWQKSCAYVELDLTNSITYNAKGEIIDQGGEFTNLNSMQDIADFE
jgi:molybdenum cofactor guanylyltransferase